MLRYIRGTLTHGLLYQNGGDLPVWGYSDSSHGNDEATRKGRGGYVFISDGAAISWRSSLLEAVTHSSCESEYVALSTAGNEALYLSQLQGELGIAGRAGVLLLGDNESSLKLAKNPVFHRRSKHIELKWHSMRERVAKGLIRLQFVKSEFQAADMLTKAVRVKILETNCAMIGLVAAP